MEAVHNDFIRVDPAAFEVSELRAIIQGVAREPRLPATIAVNVLRRKLGAGVIDELEAIAANPASPSRLRRAAINELAALDRDDVPRRLEPLIRDPEPAVARAALVGLGRRGDAGTLGLLKHRRLPEVLTPAKEMSAFLIAARVGGRPPTPRHGHVPKIVPLGRKNAAEIEVLRPNGRRIEKAIHDLADLNLPLEKDGALELDCAGQRLMFLSLTSDILADLKGYPAVVGVVARYESLESAAWLPDHYVLVGGSMRGAQIQIRTGAGTVIYSGEIVPATGKFSLAAEDRPGVVPIAITGTYEQGRIGIDKARTGIRARGAREPQRL